MTNLPGIWIVPADHGTTLIRVDRYNVTEDFQLVAGPEYLEYVMTSQTNHQSRRTAKWIEQLTLRGPVLTQAGFLLLYHYGEASKKDMMDLRQTARWEMSCFGRVQPGHTKRSGQAKMNGRICKYYLKKADTARKLVGC